MEKIEVPLGKRIPVSIIGLQNAGKSTLVARLKTNQFEKTVPTSGMDNEIIEVEGTLFQLFDLAGHRDFRSFIWENYVRLSRGIIFIIDSSKRNTSLKKLKEVNKWFWKALEWNPRATLLILANKSDLNHISKGKIMNSLELQKLPEINPSRSYRIFQVSIKTGNNIEEAFKWFGGKLSTEIGKESVTLTGLYVYLPTGVPLCTISFNPALDSDMFTGFLSAVDTFASNAMGSSEGLQSIFTANYRILMVKRMGLLCGVISDKESESVNARILAESVLKFIEKKFESEVKAFIKNGKMVNMREEIIQFIVNNFPDSLPSEYIKKF